MNWMEESKKWIGSSLMFLFIVIFLIRKFNHGIRMKIDRERMFGVRKVKRT